MAATLENIKLAMTATNDLFNTEVFGKRNFAALDQVYTSEARILPPGAPMISGRELIKKFWSDLIQSVNAQTAVLTSVEAIPSGDGIVEIGIAVLTIHPEGQSTSQLEVKYVVYWRQEEDRWKWHIDIWNTNA
jgi:ketosteroid isomerase-like protein